MQKELIVISSPNKLPNEAKQIRLLLEAGLHQFHIRKPGFNDFDMIHYISSIPSKFYPRVVLHSHYHLAEEFKLKGIQVGVKRIEEAKAYNGKFSYMGYSAHSFEEILALKEQYTDFFLSPIFNSISKKAYPSNFNIDEVATFLSSHPKLKCIALGGITPSNAQAMLEIGFNKIAVLGSIWQNDDTMEAFLSFKKEKRERPYALSIAGFDPCAGAGLTADIKSFEQEKVQGLAVNTAITYQNEDEFIAVDWLELEQIRKQMDVLFKRYHIDVIKIGLVESFAQLLSIINIIRSYTADARIIWDPILSSTTAFNFHHNLEAKKLNEILKNIHLITPNRPECEKLFGTTDVEALQGKISSKRWCKILLKGGHSSNNDVTDILIEPEKISEFAGKRIEHQSKHGTGCVLSSSIVANLAKGAPLNSAVALAKQYVSCFIGSNDGLLGYHANTI